MSLKGIIPVTVTPMNEDGSPDEPGHQRFIEHLLKHPIGGLWSLGSAGENFLMPYEHRLQTTRILSDLVNGRKPLLIGAGDSAMWNIFRFFDETADLNFDGYHVIPHDKHMNHNALVTYYTGLADTAPKPLWLYHNPHHGPPLPFEAVRELSQHANVVGLKAGYFYIPDLMNFSTLDSDDFQVIGAGGSQAVCLLAMGLRAHTASTASTCPGLFCELFSLWEQNKAHEAIALQQKFNRIWGRIPKAAENSGESSAHEKAVLEVMGICKRHVSGHFRAMTDAEIETTRRILTEEGMLSQ